MDQILVQEIDEILKQKLPMKSSISGANWIMVPPDNTQSLPLNTSNVYRIRLPKFGGGYLARSKGQTGPFLVFTLGAPNTFRAEAYATFKQIRILLNGVEVHNNLYYNHTYAEWLKKKGAQWLNSDAGQFVFPGITQTAGAGEFSAMPANGAQVGGAGLYYQQFVLPFMDNYSILNNKDHAIPLENLDIYIELYLNNQDNFMNASQAPGNTFAANTCTISNVLLYIPVVYVDPDVNRAIQAKLEAGDNNDEDMMLIPVEDIKVDAQTWDFTSAGTKTFVFHSVSSSCRLLEAILSPDFATGNADAVSQASYKTLCTVNPGIYQYQYRVDGKNVTQNPITTIPYNLAYTLYQDFVSAYNQINNDVPDMSVIPYSLFLGPAPGATYSYPGRAGVLSGATGSTFSMTANLDTVSKELVGGVKLIGNLQLDIYYTGLVGAAAGAGQANCYLIQHSNRIIAFSKSKAKVLK